MQFHRSSCSSRKTITYTQYLQKSSRVPNNIEFIIFIIDDNTSCTIMNANHWQSTQLQRHLRIPHYVKNTYVQMNNIQYEKQYHAQNLVDS